MTPVTPELLPEASRSLDVLQSFAVSYHGACERLHFSGGHSKWSYEVDNLYVHWPGSSSANHICFLGHTDVVPPGDVDRWKGHPFSGDIEGDVLKGRGATDMKAAIAGFCSSVSRFLNSNPAVRPSISLVITTDEEWAAVNGTKRVLEWMRSRQIIPDYFLIGEPSSPEKFGTHIKIGRRGSLNGSLAVDGIQGHAAYPDLFRNPNQRLIDALARLQTINWDDALSGMPATVCEIVAIRSGDFNQTAIIPATAEALWNVRFTPQQTPADLVTVLQELVEPNPERDDTSAVTDQFPVTFQANLDAVSMPYYSPAGRFAQIVSEAVAARMGLIPTIDATGGTTDGRFVSSVFPTAQVVELGLPESGGGVTSTGRGGMHQIDECCSLRDLRALSDVYLSILDRIAREP